MPGAQTTPGPTGARNDAPASVAFRGVNNVGPRVYNAFAAQWLAYTLPYRRFAVLLAEDCARIGGDVGCYSFIAVDSHHISLPVSQRTHSRYGPLNCSTARGGLWLRPGRLPDKAARQLSDHQSNDQTDYSHSPWLHDQQRYDHRCCGAVAICVGI